MKFKIELIINFDPTTSRSKIETTSISLIDSGEPLTGPIATLESNKIIFNKEALKFLNKNEGDRIGIDYGVLSDGLLHPILNLEQGNKITKTGTLSCRGTANEVLSKYGSKFIIEKFDNKFILTDLKFKKVIHEEDPAIVLPSEVEEADIGSSTFSIDDLINELDEPTVEPVKEYKDFFGNTDEGKELKDIDFESLIE
ncbi:hypothetical protein [Lachnospira sp.]|jgi:hypothetical protein|uniref:hypothetical protein n=1 Tax=Lachnospira sp. TaxID=2049031 RepID=UPI00257FB256|nr:hypothetical protein [Lachnospira sp.]